MSKRFGRNERRRARERIAKLEASAEMDRALIEGLTSLTTQVRAANIDLARENAENIARLHAVYDAIRDDSMLKPPRLDPHLYVDREQAIRFREPQRMPTSFRDAAMMDTITTFILERLELLTDEDWRRIGYHTEVRVGGTGEVALFFDRRALMEARPSVRRQYVRDRMEPLIDMLADKLGCAR